MLKKRVRKSGILKKGKLRSKLIKKFAKILADNKVRMAIFESDALFNHELLQSITITDINERTSLLDWRIGYLALEKTKK